MGEWRRVKEVLNADTPSLLLLACAFGALEITAYLLWRAQQNILWFEIAMDNTLLLQKAQASDQLLRKVTHGP